MCDPTCVADRADLLRYYGTGLQLAGILAAARGIQAVRREWTANPGVVGATRRAVFRAASWTAAGGADTWRYVRVRFLRGTQTIYAKGIDASVATDSTITVKVTYAQPSAGAEIEWLMTRVNQLLTTTQTLSNDFHAERRARETGDNTTVQALSDTEQDIRRRIADLAGGGLKLQAWGVVTLLIGVTLGTIPDQAARLANVCC